jgi:putative transposase
MANHWHLVVWPERDGDLSEFMRWLTVTHTQRWHATHHTQATGPLYQGRFKAFPVAEDEHCVRVLRYVERNPLRAGLARSAPRWRLAKPEPWQE